MMKSRQAGGSDFAEGMVLQRAERKEQGSADEDAADHVGKPVPAAEKAEQDDQQDQTLTGKDHDAAQFRVVQAASEFQGGGAEEGDAEHRMGRGERGRKLTVLEDRTVIDHELLKEKVKSQYDDVIGTEKIDVLIDRRELFALDQLQEAQKSENTADRSAM